MASAALRDPDREPSHGEEEDAEDGEDEDPVSGLPGWMMEVYVPSGISTVPFTWRCLDQEYSMELLGGFVGIAQDEGTLAVRPAIGWAVRDAWDFAAPPGPSGDAGRGQEPAYVRWVRQKREGRPVEVRGPALVVGRIALGPALPRHCALDVGQLLATARQRTGVELTCFIVEVPGTEPPPPRAQDAPVRILAGIRVASPLVDAREQLRRVPAAVWRALSALLPGGLSEQDEGHLPCLGAGDRVVYGVLTDRPHWRDPRAAELDEAAHLYPPTRESQQAIAGIALSPVLSEISRSFVVDVSAAAEEERRARLQALGLSTWVATIHVLPGPAGGR